MLSKVKLKLLFFIAFLLIGLAKAPTIKAEEILFQDDFNSTTIGPNWQIKNFTLEDSGSFGSYDNELDLIPTESYVRIYGSTSRDVGGGTVIEDGEYVGWLGKSLLLNKPLEQIPYKRYTAITHLQIPNATYQFQVHIFFEFDSNNRIVFNLGKEGENQGSEFARTQLVLDENNKYRCVGKPGQSENFSGCLSTEFGDFNLNKIYELKLEYDSQSKKVKAYIDGVAVHEGTFQSSTTSPFYSGIGSTVRKSGDYIDSHFDNFKLSSTTSAQELNVPSLKQYDVHWNEHEYDTASQWTPIPSDISVDRWGCALTSAAMLLRFYGYDILPGSLNIWLRAIEIKDKKGEFVSNGYSGGGVYWPAVAHYSVYHIGTISKELEFSYIPKNEGVPPDKNIIGQEIDAGRPSILKLKNSKGNTHFVIAKGRSNEDYLINDPDSPTITLLSEAESKYGNLIRIAKFVPENSDLSYITFFVTNGFTLKVYDPNGNFIEEGYVKEEPIAASDDPEVGGGETLNAFYLAKPETGKYRVEVSGNGNYKLKAILVDSNGEMIGDSFNSNTTRPNSFLLDFNKNSSSDTEIEEISFSQLLRNIEEAYKENAIYKKSTYLLLKNEVLVAQKQYKGGRTRVAKILLRNTSLQLLRFSPKFLEKETSDDLRENIELLVKLL